MNDDNGISTMNLIVKSANQSVNLKKVSAIEYHSDQHKGATEFHLGTTSVRMFMTHDEFKKVQLKYDDVNKDS